MLPAATALTRSLVLILALATGLAVATIYLLQPLLNVVASALTVSVAEVGMIVTITQVGYGLGILFLIPLGDTLPKKKLILIKLALLAASLSFLAVAPSFHGILFASLLIGVFATAAQDVVPFAAELAAPRERGVVVGTVMSGLLLGILLSRTASGLLADILGWRGVFWVATILMLAVAVLIAFTTPSPAPKAAIRYGTLLRSTLANFFTVPELRRAILVQSMLGLAFSAFWTNLSFHASAAPLSLSTSTIGLFGLAGAAGALAAPLAGKLSDKKGPRLGIYAGTLLVAGSFALMLAFPLSLTILFAGAVVFDLGIQMTLISHQSIIYAIKPEERARINALFVACLFGAFALGSFVSVRLYTWRGWAAVLEFSLATAVMAAATALVVNRKRK